MESRRGECFQREGVVNSHELVLSSQRKCAVDLATGSSLVILTRVYNSGVG